MLSVKRVKSTKVKYDNLRLKICFRRPNQWIFPSWYLEIGRRDAAVQRGNHVTDTKMATTNHNDRNSRFSRLILLTTSYLLLPRDVTWFVPVRAPGLAQGLTGVAPCHAQLNHRLGESGARTRPRWEQASLEMIMASIRLNLSLYATRCTSVVL